MTKANTSAHRSKRPPNVGRRRTARPTFLETPTNARSTLRRVARPTDARPTLPILPIPHRASTPTNARPALSILPIPQRASTPTHARPTLPIPPGAPTTTEPEGMIMRTNAGTIQTQSGTDSQGNVSRPVVDDEIRNDGKGTKPASLR